MNKPKILDLFCKAGGASMGLSRAGFDVTGVDIELQPNYPFEFIQADALEVSLEGYGAYWASPICQGFSRLTKNRWGKKYVNQIPAIRERLLGTGKPFIIENVPGAPLKNPIMLNGTMFGLKVIRDRWFELHGFEILLNPSPLLPKRPILDGNYFTVAGHGGNSKDYRLKTWQDAMGINWMSKQELTQAIPPAYSEYLGKELIKYV